MATRKTAYLSEKARLRRSFGSIALSNANRREEIRLQPVEMECNIEEVKAAATDRLRIVNKI